MNEKPEKMKKGVEKKSVEPCLVQKNSMLKQRSNSFWLESL